jgi:hypothetical protein
VPRLPPERHRDEHREKAQRRPGGCDQYLEKRIASEAGVRRAHEPDQPEVFRGEDRDGDEVAEEDSAHRQRLD